MSSDTVMDLGDLLLLSGVPAIILFAVFYGVRSKWRSTNPGRSLFYMSVAMSVILILSAVTRYLGAEWPFREWIRLVIYGSVSVTMWRMFVVLLRTQAKSRDKEVEK